MNSILFRREKLEALICDLFSYNTTKAMRLFNIVVNDKKLESFSLSLSLLRLCGPSLKRLEAIVESCH